MSEEQVNQAVTKYKDFLQEQGGEEIEIQHRGKRRLAYPIERHREGVYIQMNYKAPPIHEAQLQRAMRSLQIVPHLPDVPPERLYYPHLPHLSHIPS
ncbi:ribosomal protein S6 [Coleofasciculus chthonoplastes PCC 7420]|uniref:Small ribosomal subunit protein bS6 n=1 Tax=Coleofasciculus chthonoplastes PCC 7420 TaxID=118168 RepID=B4VUN5_9CYAN|nr:ribosomal protein S6 [Coleofasciculus chthonoplastes PCC 7420]